MMSRFVVLYHEVNPDCGRPNHYDLMVESPASKASNRANSLWTWQILTPPGIGVFAAVRLENHRIEYLDYEGPVSGDRGRVTRVMQGDADWVAVEGGRWQVRLTNSAVDWLLEIVVGQGDNHSIKITAVGDA